MKSISACWVVLFLLISSPVKGEESKADKKEWCYGDYTFGIAAGVVAVAAAPFALSAAGFTASGVAAYSVAAGVQSAVYGGAVGSSTVFAVLQSAGAAGLGLGANLAIGSTVGSVATYIKSKVYPCQEEPNGAPCGKK